MKALITISKTFPEIPFGHRQPQHGGHCRFIHGHNWSFTFTFAADELDENGFVLDFGQLKWLQGWLHETFDHAMVFADSDEMGRAMVAAFPQAFKARFLSDVSAEGIAQYALQYVNNVLTNTYDRNVRAIRVTLHEDSKNLCEVGAF